MTKSDLIKRLTWYYPLERMHAFLTFPLLIAYLLFTYAWSDLILLIYGLLFCNFILFQGQHYWKLKLDKLSGKSFEQNKNLTFFRKSKRANLILICLIPVLLMVQLYFSKWVTKMDNLLLWGIVANIFGVLEYINYYIRQLMIDNLSDLKYVLRNRKLKIASLAKDLSKSEI